MSKQNLFLREAVPADLDLLFEWANNEKVRENAFNTKKIPYEEHKKWFEKLLNDSRQIQFIMMSGNEPIGQVRLSIHANEEEAEIDYSIAAEKRGMGYGRELIRLIQEIVQHKYGFIKKLTAKVKTSNMASISCFKRNGFSDIYTQYEYKISHH